MGSNKKTGRISPIRKEFSPQHQNSIGGSLAKNGLSRWPGSAETLIIQPDPKTGKYMTGLDPDASYIKRMSPAEAEQEKAKIAEYLEYIVNMTGYPAEYFGPRGDYYTKMMEYFGETNGEMKAVQPYKMKDGVNLFDLENPYNLISYCWLRVHPKVAPSYRSFELGQASPDCRYFVDDEEYAAEITYKQKTRVNKAIANWNQASPLDRKKIAMLLGLAVHPGSTEEQVYNVGDAFIKEAEKKNGHTLSNINRFEQVLSYQQENLNVRYYVELALYYNVYRTQDKLIYEGQVMKANSKEDLIVYLSSPKNSHELSLLQDKLKEVEVRDTV